MELLFKAVAQVHHVVVGLGVLGKAGLLRLDAQLLQLPTAYLLQPLLAGQNVHGQFLIIFQVQLIHLIEHGDVLHQRDLMLLQGLGNAVHIGLHLAVLGLHALNLVAGLAEQTRQPLFLLAGAKALQLHHQLAEVSAHLAQVLAAHIAQGVLGEARHALLGGGAVLQDHVGALGSRVSSGIATSVSVGFRVSSGVMFSVIVQSSLSYSSSWMPPSVGSVLFSFSSFTVR